MAEQIQCGSLSTTIFLQLIALEREREREYFLISFEVDWGLRGVFGIVWL